MGKICPLRANVLFLMIHIVCFSFKVLLFRKLWHKLNHLPVVTKLVSLSWLMLLIDNSDGAAYLHLTGNLSLQSPHQVFSLAPLTSLDEVLHTISKQTVPCSLHVSCATFPSMGGQGRCPGDFFVSHS